MLTQQKLASMAPFLSQYLMNGPFIAQLAKSGQTVDFGEFSKLIQDATGTKDSYKLFRPLTQQEQQAQGQPPPEAVMKKQISDAQIASRERIAQIEADAKKEAAAAMAAKGDEQMSLDLLQLFLQNDTSLGLQPQGAAPTLGAAPGAQSMLSGQPGAPQGPGGPMPPPGPGGPLG
jgi:hypothetical protein